MLDLLNIFTEVRNLHACKYWLKYFELSDFFPFANEKSLNSSVMMLCEFSQMWNFQCIFHLNHLVNSNLIQFIIFLIFSTLLNIWLNYFSSILILIHTTINL